VFFPRSVGDRSLPNFDDGEVRPIRDARRQPSGDVVWIGNWGDEERTAELEEFLFEPVRELGLRATVYGVRYPDEARARLAADGITYGGWLPNHAVPEVLARSKVTIHIPRRPYLEALPGVPTIRPFEALACGIPLVSARWDRSAGLLTPGEDFLVARDGGEMKQHLRALMDDEPRRQALAARGLATIRARHTCAHRVDELLGICEEVRLKVDTTEVRLKADTTEVRLKADTTYVDRTVRLQPDHEARP
jgi:spore maturation protein CgeB